MDFRKPGGGPNLRPPRHRTLSSRNPTTPSCTHESAALARHALGACALLAAALFSPHASAGSNLIVNSGAEAGAGSDSGSDVIAAPAWATAAGSNFTVVSYNDTNGGPTLVSPGPVNRGLNYFAGGPDNSESSATQLIDLGFAAADIAAGHIRFTLSGWLGGYSGQNDHTLLSATWLDAGGQALGAVTLDSVFAPDRDSETGLLFSTLGGAVPVATRQVLITLDMLRTDGSYNDAYADELSFSLSGGAAAVPEPTTYALMLAGLAGVGALSQHRRRARATGPAA